MCSRSSRMLSFSFWERFFISYSTSHSGSISGVNFEVTVVLGALYAKSRKWSIFCFAVKWSSSSIWRFDLVFPSEISIFIFMGFSP